MQGISHYSDVAPHRVGIKEGSDQFPVRSLRQIYRVVPCREGFGKALQNPGNARSQQERRTGGTQFRYIRRSTRLYHHFQRCRLRTPRFISSDRRTAHLLLPVEERRSPKNSQIPFRPSTANSQFGYDFGYRATQ